MYTFATSKHFVAFTRFYPSVSGAFRALSVDLSHYQSDLSSTTNKPSFSSKFISHSSRCFADRQEHSNDVRLIYGVALFIVIVIVMLIVLLCVFIMYLALTATLREHRAFLLESATREEQERVNRGQRELEADRRSNAEEERPREFARRRLPVQHDERRCVGVSIRFI